MPLAKGWVQPHPEAGATRETHGPGALGWVTLHLLTSLEKDLLLRSQAGATLPGQQQGKWSFQVTQPQAGIHVSVFAGHITAQNKDHISPLSSSLGSDLRSGQWCVNQAWCRNFQTFPKGGQGCFPLLPCS